MLLQNTTPNRILEIIRPEPGTIRTRKIVTRSRSRSTGKYPSWKMGRMVQWESPHELNALRLLDANPAVKSFHEQPVEIVYSLNGEEKSHYPDVEVILDSNIKEFWEIKTRENASEEEVALRTALMCEHLPNFGYTYKVVLAEDLARQPRLRSALTLLRWGRMQPELPLLEQLRLLFLQSGSLPWKLFLDPSQKVLKHAVCWAILHGQIALDLDSGLSENTELQWGG